MRGKKSGAHRFSTGFTDKLYETMWQFINEDMMRSMYPKSRINYTTQARVDDDNFTPAQANSICFKGPRDDGHWVYIDHNLVGHSTYEDKLILQADDGVCHAAAMINAFESNTDAFRLITRPTNLEESNKNYRSILLYYMFLITSKKWDRALRANFFSDVDWTRHTYIFGRVQTTIQTIESYNLLAKEYLRFV